MTLGDDLKLLGGILRCEECGKQQPIGTAQRIADRLSGSGWPKCCGYTMTWVTQKLLDKELEDSNA